MQLFISTRTAVTAAFSLRCYSLGHIYFPQFHTVVDLQPMDT